MSTERRHALLVATGSYEDAGLSGLWAPSRDATELARVLGDPEIGDFEVEVLSDPGAHELRRKVEDFFADRSVADTLLLHFACHGLKDEGGKLFLAAADTVRTRLESTAIPTEYVSRLMMRSRVLRAAVLLDCCYAGAFERGMFTRADAEVHVEDSFASLERAGSERGRAVLTASSAVEYAFEGSRVVANEAAESAMEAGPDAGEPGPSLFTGALVTGLHTGEADLGGDGEIGLAELAEYIGRRIRAVTPHQTPQLWMFGAQGDLTIAHAPVRRGRGVPGLPPELASEAGSTEREKRHWAVEDLKTLLNGPDTATALDALTVLEQLTHDDSRRVSDAARGALAAAAPIVPESHWDLGVTFPGQPGPDVNVPVHGPPVVHATVEAIGGPWLRSRRTAAGIALSVLTDAPGVYEGEVTVRTATGQQVLTVRADVTEPVEQPPRGQREPRRRLHWSPSWVHAATAALMLVTLALPVFRSTGAGTLWCWRGAGLFVGVPALTAVLVCAAVVRGRPETGRGLARWGAVGAAVCVTATLGTGAAVLADAHLELRAGYVVFAAASGLYAWSAVLLRRAAGPSEAGAPSLPLRLLRSPWGRVVSTASAGLLVAAASLSAALLSSDHDAIAPYDRPRGDILVGSTRVTGSFHTAGENSYLRAYSNGPLYAAVTGYASQSKGISLLESAEDKVLSATRTGQLRGGDVVTTIDPVAQKAAYTGLSRHGKGAVVALNPSSGAILALVSTPSYDPSTFAGVSKKDAAAWAELSDDSARPLLNRALQQTYPAGSTFKVVTAAAALQNQLYTSADQKTRSPEPWIMPGSKIELANEGNIPCENATLRVALRDSCNSVFGKIGTDLGPDVMAAEAKKFGFGSAQITPVRSKTSTFAQHTNAAQTALGSIGQFDTAATPLQMAMVAAAVANDGRLMKPYLVARTEKSGTVTVGHPEELSRPLTAANAEILQSMMETVVQDGTGTKARISGVSVGGKTGTAQSGVEGANRPFAWFISYARLGDGTSPVAVAVVVEDANADGYDISGGGLAAPIAKSVMEAVLNE
jgi:peptidoglycan glycosyltransferase